MPKNYNIYNTKNKTCQEKGHLKIPDFQNKKILIMGLGLHGGGVGAAKFFVQAGAKVTVTDLRTRQQLKESLNQLKGLPIKYILGKHREEDFKNADLIIRNPAVPDESPYLKIAQKHNVPIDTDIGIFFELLTASTPTGTDLVGSTTRSVPVEPKQPTIIGITGTRGKSTTSTLIYEFLKTKYPNAILAGNIRKSVLSELPKIIKRCHPESASWRTKDLINNKCTARMRFFTPLRGVYPEPRRRVQNDNFRPLVVLELSSWQIEGLEKHKKSPHIAVITNIMPDHLNRYKRMKEYIKAKKGIFKFQTKNDFLFLNQNDKIVKGFIKKTKSRVIFYSAKETEKFQTNLPGKHNLANIAAAVKVAKHFRIGKSAIKKVLKNFKGLEGRIQPIAEINGVKYINDTCATTPDATIAAINSLSKIYNPKSNNLILIAGGADKNLDFNELAKLIAEKVNALILLKGTATNKLEKTIKNTFKTKRVPVHYFPRSYKIVNKGLCATIRRADSMSKAVKTAYNITRAGDIVLLSPACASFGMFRHEFERGNKFIEAVLAYKNKSPLYVKTNV